MKLDFVKMHGLGNDFVLIDAVTQKVSLNDQQIRQLANRKFGIGFDQLLLAELPSTENVDFRYRIFNSDGSEVEQCGNGARCFAQFVRYKGLTDKERIKVETLAGELTLEVRDKSMVTVDMGIPVFDPASIPFQAQHASETYQVTLDSNQVEFSVVAIGNPHAVIFVDDVQTAAVQDIGSQLENHAWFPNRTNVQFVQLENRSKINQRIFERGVGETMASGSGACAAVAVARRLDLVDETVQVQMPGGSLEIHCENNTGRIFMTGPTEFSFEGSVTL